MREIARPDLERRVARALRRSPVVAILGPRQCGKTTLARTLTAGKRGEFFDLEDPKSQRRLEQPMTALEALRGLVVIDEVQLFRSHVPGTRLATIRRRDPG